MTNVDHPAFPYSSGTPEAADLVGYHSEVGCHARASVFSHGSGPAVLMVPPKISLRPVMWVPIPLPTASDNDHRPAIDVFCFDRLAILLLG